jgi:hypothetical protein
MRGRVETGIRTTIREKANRSGQNWVGHSHKGCSMHGLTCNLQGAGGGLSSTSLTMVNPTVLVLVPRCLVAVPKERWETS